MKPTKTALKKAAKAARLEKRQLRATASGRNSPFPPSPISADDDELATPENHVELPLQAVDDHPVVTVVEQEAEPKSKPVVESQPPPVVEPQTPVVKPLPPVVKPQLPVVEPQLSVVAPQPLVVKPQPPAVAPRPTPAAPPPQREPSPLVLMTLPQKQTVPESAPSSSDAEQTIKRQNMVTRTLWTFIMIGGFISSYFTSFHFDFEF